MHKVFKVCTEYRGTLASAVVYDSSYGVEYELGETTHPKPFRPQAWLMAFDTLEHAREYAKDEEAFRIFEAEATAVKPVKRIGDWLYDRMMDLFWTEEGARDNGLTVPSGSLWCSDIKLIKEVDRARSL